LIDIVLAQCELTKLPVVVAVPFGDKKIAEMLPGKNVFFGSECDVIARYYHCAKEYEFDPVIRVTADAKKIHHELILQQLENYKKFDHVVYGNFCEVVPFQLLEWHYKYDKRQATREHVTLGMLQDMSVDYEIDLN